MPKIVNLLKYQYYQFHEEFDEWPRDKYGNLEPIFLTNKCQELFEHVLSEFEKMERRLRRSGGERKIFNLQGYVETIIIGYLSRIVNKTSFHTQKENVIKRKKKAQMGFNWFQMRKFAFSYHQVKIIFVK